MRFSFLFVSTLAFVSAAASGTPDARAVVLERLEASVNSSTVLLSDVSGFRKSLALRAQLDPLFANTEIAKKGPNATDEQIVDFLIDEKIILEAFPVSDNEVEQEINSIQANNNVNRQQLRNLLREQGFDFDDYFELIRISTAKRNLIDREIRTKVTISEDDVKNHYYNKYAKGDSSPRAYRVKIITVSPGNYKNPTAAREVAQRALTQIRSGEAFEEVAKRISDDPSAPEGGDLGVLSEDEMSSVIRKELKKLKIGEVSAVLGSSDSRFFILKLADISSAQGQRYERMKDQIMAQLSATEYQRQIGLWLERKRASAFIHRAGEPTIAGLRQPRKK